MTDNPAIVYRPRADASPEAELDALASVYKFVLDCSDARRGNEKAEGRLPSPDGRDDAKEIRNECAANGIIPD